MKVGRLLLLCAAAAAPQTGALAAWQEAADSLVLKAGTPVPLETAAALHSKTHRQGDRFELLVDEDVLVGGHVAIPRGAKALGEIAKHTAKGPYGKAGRLELRLLYVTAGGRNIRLDGAQAEKGEGNEVPSVAAGLVSGAIGAFIFGKSASLPAGTAVTGYVHRDLPLAPSD
jgi:hypothetical protein